MKKRFLKVALLGAMAFTLPVSFYSCKDYDEDIQGLQQEDSEMQSQISALEKALESTKSELEAAKKSAADALKLAEESKAAAEAAAAKGDDALAAAEKAQAEALAAKALAEEAKAAAAQAKQEAIEEAVAQCKELMKDLASQEDVTALADQIAALSGKINGIEANLSTLDEKVKELDGKVGGALEDIEALNTWKATVDQQIKTLQAYEARIAELEQKLEGLDLKQMAADLKDLQGRVAELEKELAEKADKTEVADLKSELTELNNRVDEFLKEGGAFDQYKNEIASSLNTIKNALAYRLTSLVFQPTLYVDGIPAIEIPSIQYTPKKWDSEKHELVAIKDAKTFYIDAKNTKLTYNLNPSGVTDADIDLGGIELADAIVETRVENDKYVSIVPGKSEVVNNNGKHQLIVNIQKNDVNDNSLAGKLLKDNAYIVSLNVPIAQKNLMESEKDGAWVSSEYTRVVETTVNINMMGKYYADPSVNEPKLVDLTNYAGAYSYAAGDGILADVLYSTKDYDLNKHITAVYGNNVELDAETLESYGIKFVYGKGESEYMLGNPSADQQAFCTVTSDGKLNAKSLNGNEDPVTAIGKEPIIWVEMRDANNNNNLLDRKYFKVRFVREDQTPYEVSYGYGNVVLGCNGIEAKMTWDKFHKYILDQIGMDQETFLKKYGNDNKWYNIQENGAGIGHINVNTGDIAPGTGIITWTLTNEEIGEIKVVDGKAEKKFAGVLLIRSNTGLEKPIKIKLYVNVVAELPTIYGYKSAAWLENNSIYELLPISYESRGNNSYAEYDNNLIAGGFNLEGGKFLMTNFAQYNCRRWEMQFTADGQPTGYTAETYMLKKNGVAKAGAMLEWPGDYAHRLWKSYETTSLNFVLDKQAGIAAQDLIGKDVQLGIYAKINDYNTYTIKKFKVRILEPLKFSVTNPTKGFTDAQTEGSKVSVSNALSASENRRSTGNILAKPAMKEYYQLNVKWNTEAARISMKMNGGTTVVDNTLEPKDGMLLKDALKEANLTYSQNELVFTNGEGSLVHEKCNIFVPVEFTHRWGKVTYYVTIPLEPAK